METIVATIKSNRPNLSSSSLRTYGYVLKKLLGQLDIEEKDFKKILDHPQKVLEILKDQTPQSRKTTLAVLISLFGRNEKTDLFHNQMLRDAQKYNDILKSQNKTTKQTENWMSWAEVQKVYNDLYKHLNPLWKKQKLSKKDLLNLVDLIMLSVYVLIPPRRSTDYVLMKIKNYTEKDNYLDLKKGEFVFNQYKTAKTYGQNIVKIPTKLKTLLKKWVAVNPTDYLLFDSKMSPLTQSRLTIKLNNIFDKNISSSLLRHIYITDVVLKDAPKITELEKVASQMGHSTSAQAEYRVL